ncbi:hypothetical protein AWC08_10510 [Mycobacterium gordonae]|uniref:Uncharacterized protein n=1 Tax=Mycobacterium gordonae TaxID=1778 RepID=A0A1X1V9P0_MYCGO|nr:hypothetical protein AWC08_10510 [Mycobacterium gordonae]
MHASLEFVPADIKALGNRAPAEGARVGIEYIMGSGEDRQTRQPVQRPHARAEQGSVEWIPAGVADSGRPQIVEVEERVDPGDVGHVRVGQPEMHPRRQQQGIGRLWQASVAHRVAQREGHSAAG